MGKHIWRESSREKEIPMHPPCAIRPLIVPPFQIASLVLFLAATLLAAEPGPSPHRFIPAKGLVAYLEYEGLDAHAAAWKASGPLWS